MFRFNIKRQTYTVIFHHFIQGDVVPIYVENHHHLLDSEKRTVRVGDLDWVCNDRGECISLLRFSCTSIHDGKIGYNDANEQNNVAVGVSLCHPKDNFSRKIGRRISFDRAMSNLFPNDAQKNIRKAVWNKYFQDVEKLNIVKG